MKTHKNNKRVASASVKARPLPANYTCVDPDEALKMFDYLNGGDETTKEIATRHLGVCLHCQEAVAALMIVKGVDVPGAHGVEVREEEIVTV